MSELVPKSPVAWQYELATGLDKDSNICTGWQLHLSPYRPSVPERSIRNLMALHPLEPGSVVFDPAEVEFMAARVRRLCAYFDYPTPNQNDAFIVAVTPSLIGALLTKLERALPRYTHDTKGGKYELLGEAMPAGTLKPAPNLAVYRDVSDGPMRGQLFYRELDDFAKRMIPLSERSETGD